MRIRTKLITTFLTIAIVFSLIGYYAVQNTAHVGELFERVESDSVPSLTSLLEIMAATRQASIKAMEYSMRSQQQDREKALEALEKISSHLAAYKTTMLDQEPARAWNLDARIERFTEVIQAYLTLGAGPSIAELIKDVDKLHEYRSELIHTVNQAIELESLKMRPPLQQMKSEARKLSIKAVEFAMDSNPEDELKFAEARENLISHLNRYISQTSTGSALGQRLAEKSANFLEFSDRYIASIAARNISYKDITEVERQVHETRREVIHALYPLIETEQQALHQAAAQTRQSISDSAYILMASITAVVIFALVAGFVVAGSITGPLQQLNEAAQQVASGNLDQELKVVSADEVGELASSFEHMKIELKKHRNDLEALVQQRTLDLNNSNQELESYSYSIAHDLRAPLRSIAGFSQILLEDAGERLSEEDQDHLQRIIRSASHMGELIDDILELSRISRSQMEFKPVNLSDICVEISQTMSASDPQRQVEWQIQPGLVAVGDQRLLYIVLSNLLGNAWKFTQHKSPAIIEVGVTPDVDEKLYFVKDNGVGFDMRFVEKLFGVFQRLHRAEEYEGTGVGLATVERIIKRHDGRVWAESIPGKGSTFYFSLADKPPGAIRTQKSQATTVRA